MALICWGDNERTEPIFNWLCSWGYSATLVSLSDHEPRCSPRAWAKPSIAGQQTRADVHLSGTVPDGGRDRDRTCDPSRVKGVLYR
jgi:hypothetical protein